MLPVTVLPAFFIYFGIAATFFFQWFVQILMLADPSEEKTVCQNQLETKKDIILKIIVIFFDKGIHVVQVLRVLISF